MLGVMTRTRAGTASRVDGFSASADHSSEWLFPAADQPRQATFIRALRHLAATGEAWAYHVPVLGVHARAARTGRPGWIVGDGDLSCQFAAHRLLNEVMGAQGHRATSISPLRRLMMAA